MHLTAERGQSQAMNQFSLFRVLHTIAKAQVILAFVGLVIGALFWIPAVSFYNRAQVTTGIVTTFNTNENMAAPVFTFKDAGGIEHRKASDLYSDPPSFVVGQKISIRFLQEDPTSARPDTFWDLWGMPIIIGIASGVVLVFAIVGRRVLKHFDPMKT